MYTSKLNNEHIEFMKKHNLNYICFTNPNGEYFVKDYNSKHPYSSHSFIRTDGYKKSNSNPATNKSFVKVFDATWVLHVQVHHFKNYKQSSIKILYTKNRNISNIKLLLDID